MSRPAAPAPLTVKRGERVEIVRWVNTRDGWQPETITGFYARRTPDQLVLVVEGRPQGFSRREWELCSP